MAWPLLAAFSNRSAATPSSFFMPLAGKREGAQGKLGVGIAEIGGFAVGLGGLGVILRDAEPFLVDFAKKRVGLLRALRGLGLGELPRRHVLALRIGLEGRAFRGFARERQPPRASRLRAAGGGGRPPLHAALLASRKAAPIPAIRAGASSASQISGERATKSAPRPASCGGLLLSFDVPGDARHHENLRPPGDQPGAFLPLAAGKRGGGTECNIIRTKLRQQHGVMTTFVATNAYDRALT